MSSPDTTLPTPIGCIEPGTDDPDAVLTLVVLDAGAASAWDSNPETGHPPRLLAQSKTGAHVLRLPVGNGTCVGFWLNQGPVDVFRIAADRIALLDPPLDYLPLDNDDSDPVRDDLLSALREGTPEDAEEIASIEVSSGALVVMNIQHDVSQLDHVLSQLRPDAPISRFDECVVATLPPGPYRVMKKHFDEVEAVAAFVVPRHAR